MAGSLGGRARVRLYGNPGTEEGRRRGGLKSIASQRGKKSGFKSLKQIKKPRKSEQLAELMGILAGDGHVGQYQTSVVTNAQTDYEHALYVQKLLKETFKLPVSLNKRRNSNALVILLSSKNACDYLRTIGMPSGNKTRDQLQPPSWIFENTKFKKAYLRGLIDTGGCVYLDRHRVKGKDYASYCIAFTSASVPLLDFVEHILCNEGFSPTRWGRNVRLRRKRDVLEYVKQIGFSNPKHARRVVL